MLKATPGFSDIRTKVTTSKLEMSLMAQSKEKQESIMMGTKFSDIPLAEGLGASLKSLKPCLQNELRKPAPAHAASKAFTRPTTVTSASEDISPLDLSKVSNSTCSWGGSAAEIADNQQLCPFPSGMSGNDWMQGVPYGQDAYLQNYASSAQWAYMWPYHQYAQASHLAYSPLQWIPLSAGPGSWSFENLNKVYPVVPQPVYPNGQPYSGGSGYQCLTSSYQSFSATHNYSGGVNSSQYWNQATSPPQCASYAYSGSAHTNTEPVGFENLVMTNAQSVTSCLSGAKNVTERERLQNIIPDHGEPNVSVIYPTSTERSFCSPPTLCKEPAYQMHPAPEGGRNNSDFDMKFSSGTPEHTGENGAPRTKRTKQTRRKKLGKIETKAEAEQQCVATVYQEATSTTNSERKTENSVHFEAVDEQLRYELRSAQNKTIDKRLKGRKKSATGSVSSKRKRSRQVKVPCPPDSSTLEEPSVIPLADGDGDQIIVRKMKEWTLNSQEGETVLHRAASLGLSDVVEYCLRIGLVSSPNCVNSSGCTPLHEACSHGHDHVAHILLSHGAGPNKASISGLRPIQIARQHGNDKIVKLLLEFGAELGDW